LAFANWPDFWCGYSDFVIITKVMHMALTIA